MKNLRITFSLLVTMFCVVKVSAQDLNDELKQNYNLFNSATAINKEAAGIKFEQLTAKWPKQWDANYYAAYADAAISTNLQDSKKREAYLDKADRYLKEVIALNKLPDETYVLTAYIAYARFLIDPSKRWKQYMPLINDNLDKAQKLNPANPRIYYLQGVPVFHKPKLFGGGKNKAKPYFEKARELFAKQDASSIDKPSWGEKENADYLAQCNQ